MRLITKSDIYKVENPGQFTEPEWKESLRFVYLNSVEGLSASMASSCYESVEAIHYIREQLNN